MQEYCFIITNKDMTFLLSEKIIGLLKGLSFTSIEEQLQADINSFILDCDGNCLGLCSNACTGDCIGWCEGTLRADF